MSANDCDYIVYLDADDFIQTDSKSLSLVQKAYRKAKLLWLRLLYNLRLIPGYYLDLDKTWRIHQMETCDCYGCDEPVCDEDKKLRPPTLRFCQAHSDECLSFIQDGDAPGLLRFWVKECGGWIREVDDETG